MITRYYAHPHGFIAGGDELRSLAEACETTANHYTTIANQDEYREHTGRAVQWRAKSQKFASLAKNLREILAED